ncbi:MAG TPA: hypothetical protein VN846_01345 [Candidatus Cybelea sp.]|jgi:hypothetical protein|nr:hypothetical protein [Candidatus Cybelea sp.]
MDGRVTDEELRRYYRDAELYTTGTDPLSGILDLSGVTSFEVSPELVRELASLPPAMADRARPRVLIATSAAVFGLARMFELHGQESRPNLHVVRSEKEALAILGVSRPSFKPIQGK